jgi:hypothetical protein
MKKKIIIALTGIALNYFTGSSLLYASNLNFAQKKIMIEKNLRGDKLDDLNLTEADMSELFTLLQQRNLSRINEIISQKRQAKIAAQTAASVTKEAEVKINTLEKQLQEKHDALQEQMTHLAKSKEEINTLKAKEAKLEALQKLVDQHKELIEEMQKKLEAEPDPHKKIALAKNALATIQSLHQSQAQSSAIRASGTTDSGTGTGTPSNSSSLNGGNGSLGGTSHSGGSGTGLGGGPSHGGTATPGSTPPPPPPQLPQTVEAKIDQLLKRTSYISLKPKLMLGDADAKRDLQLNKILHLLKSLVASLPSVNQDKSNIIVMNTTYANISRKGEALLKQGFDELLKNMSNPALLFDKINNSKQFKLLEYFGVKSTAPSPSTLKSPAGGTAPNIIRYPDKDQIENMLGTQLVTIVSQILRAGDNYNKFFQGLNSYQRYIPCTNAINKNGLNKRPGFDQQQTYALFMCWQLIEKGKNNIGNILAENEIEKRQALLKEYQEDLVKLGSNPHVLPHIKFIKEHTKEIEVEILQLEASNKKIIDSFNDAYFGVYEQEFRCA